jgi:parallel beta-helix repeat protein
VVTSPVPGAAVSGIVPLEGTAVARTGHVAWVDWLVDGAVAVSDTRAPFAQTWDSSRVPAGSHTLQLAAWTSEGARSLSTAVTITTDGVARYDATASPGSTLAQAIGLLHGHAGTVFLPAGTYAASNSTIPAGVTVFGAGSSTVLRAPDGANYSSVVSMRGNGSALRFVAIDGNAAHETAGEGWAIEAHGVDDVLVQGVTIGGIRRDGLHLWGPHQRVSLQDSAFDGAGIASSGVCDQVSDPASGATSVLRTTIRGFVDFGVNFFPWTASGTFPGADAVAAGNTITAIQDPNQANGTNEGGIWTGGDDAVIVDNHIADTGWDGIETFGHTNGAHVLRNTITDTHVGIYLEHQTNDSVFEGNTILRVDSTGINVEWFYGGVGSQRNVFTHNTIAGAQWGVTIDVGANDNTIAGNAITGSRLAAVRLQGTSRNTVTGNDLRSTAQAYGVQETNGRWDSGALAVPDHNTVTGNDARGSVSGGTSLYGAGDVASANLWH